MERLPMPPEVPSTPIPVDLEGKVKLGIQTLMAILVSVVVGMVTLFGIWSTVATKVDLKTLLDDHTSRPDAHPKQAGSVQDIQTKLASTEARTKRLEEKQDDTQQSVEYIRARIDFLTEQTVRQVVSQRSGAQAQGRQAGERAVQRLRSSGDPVEAISQ
jgi:membrane protein involved in colicin uptake